MVPNTLRIALASLTLVMLVQGIASAATPSSGTISDTAPTLTYGGGPLLVSNPTPTPVQTAPTCNAATTCDAFTLTVSLPANYQALHPDDYVACRIDWESLGGDTARADLDLWIYQGSTIYTSSASINAAEIAYLPAVSGTYILRVVPFHAQGETYTGTVTLGPLPPTGIADGLFRSSSDVWSKNVRLTAPGHTSDLEPAVRFDLDGNCYVGSNGPGVGLWKITDPCGQQIASFVEPESPLTTGGGDVDVEIAPVKNALGFYNIYTSSLYALVNFNSSVSSDGGATWLTTPLSTTNVVDDRQWNAAHGANTIYLSYHSVSGGFNIYLVRSDAGGAPGSYVGPFLVNQDVAFTSTLYNSLGNMVADQRPVPPLTPPNLAGPNGEANLYHGFVEAGNKVYVGVSKDFGVTWSSKLAYDGGVGANYSHMFTWVAVDQAGNLYTAFCDDRNIYYCFSTDQGVHWSQPRRVSNGAGTKVSVFPAMAAGSAGRVVFSWYGAQGRNADDPNNQWQVFTARCQNALSTAPVFEQTVASDHIVHLGRVCEQGTNCSSGRQLLDLFEMDVDPTDGSSFITYTNDTGGRGTNITKQLSGTSAIAGKSIVDKSSTCPSSLPCPAFTLSAPETLNVPEGGTRDADFVITNDGNAAGTFRYELEGAECGEIVASSAPTSGVTPGIASGESFALHVTFRAHCSDVVCMYQWKAAGSGSACAADSTAETFTICQGTTAVADGLGSGFGLSAAAPNPFDRSTSLNWRVPERSRVSVELFTVAGRRVRTVLDETREAGQGQVRIESRGLSAGVYLVRLRAGARTQVRRIMVLR